ncbi:MAG: glutaredoxin family protein [Chloroflexota bacterium]
MKGEPEFQALTHVPVAILYSTPECHLCHEARDILRTFEATGQISIEEVNVRSTADLERAYGLLIPVLQIAPSSTLNWPFTAYDVERMLAQTRT